MGEKDGRRPIVAGNWKMNTTVAEGTALARDIVSRLGEPDPVDVALCPPFTGLTTVRDAIAGSPLLLGAQNMNANAQGAYTGEVSWTMLQGLCSHVILGHSERRQYFQETDAAVNAKVRAALAAGLTPIACVGEHAEQRDRGETSAVCERQVRAIFESVAPDDARRVVIAYEPLWAIGSGRPATSVAAQEVALLIRGVVRELYGADVAAAVRVQYGGSVTAANAAEFAGQPDVDGALVGGASLKAADFAGIARAFASKAR